MFFPRGPGPLVSIMLPTRGRPSHLLAAIDSAVSLATDHTNIEWLLKIDDDDIPTIKAVEELHRAFPSLNLKWVVSPRGDGYFAMHHWINDLANRATGDWLFLFNDDARFKTQGWDVTLSIMGTKNPWIGISDICLLVAPTIDRPFAQEFFFLRRKTVDILGHLSLSPHNDNWIHTVMNFVGAKLQTSIEIEHLSAVIDDDIRKSTVEAYKTTILSMETIEARRLLWEDANTLLSHMERLEKRVQWTDAPLSGDCGYFLRVKGGRQEICFIHGGTLYLLETNEKHEAVPKVVDVAPKGLWAPMNACMGA